MSRHRLAAWLPAEERARILELRIRELVRHAETLAAAAEELGREIDPGAPWPAEVSSDRLEELLAGVARLETIAHRPFRRRLSAVDRPAAGVRQLRAFG